MPRARGRNRRRVGPWSTNSLDEQIIDIDARVVTTCLVFGICDSGLNQVLDHLCRLLASECENLESLTPSRPRTRSATGEPSRRYSCQSQYSLGFHNLVLSQRTRDFLSAAAARSGRCELAQLMADHVLSDVDRNEFLSVMNGESQSKEIGKDGRASAQVLMTWRPPLS